MGAYPQGNNKERKLYLERRRLISCSYCKYHRHENLRKGWKQRPDKYKEKYRMQRRFKYRNVTKEREYQLFLTYGLPFICMR